MNSPKSPIDLVIGPEEPVYRQIYSRIRSAILDGTLRPGSRLPSWNALAAELSVARGTVKAAYDWLAGEGYLVGLGAAGTMVNPALPGSSMKPAHAAPKASAPESSRAREPGLEVAWGAPARPFQMGLPALDLFPRKLWSRLAARNAARLSPAGMVYQDPAGLWKLREAIAGYLAIARGVPCKASEILVTSGFSGALNLICRALLEGGDRVWLEDPGYIRAREGLRLAGATVVPVPVDSEGLMVSEGLRRAPSARFALVTPSHQAPLGMSLSLPRRLALLDWSARTESWIIEDDYYGEFRFAGRPLPALRSLDSAGRVIYVGTFSKVLLPGLRLGYVVAPTEQVDLFTRVASYLMPSPSLLAQATVADFMQLGHFGRHIRRMRAAYAKRREALVAALEDEFGGRIRVDLQEGGMHLVACLASDVDDIDVARRCASRDLAPVPLSPWALETRTGPGLLLNFANIAPQDAAREVRKLRAIIPNGRVSSSI